MAMGPLTTYICPNEESPGFIRGWLSADDDRFSRFIERFFARRLGITDEQMVPQSLIFLKDPEEAKNSWKNYLAGTDFYQTRLRIWEENKISDPQAEKPDPIEVMEELIEIAMDMEIPSNQNHLTVRLPLPSKPLRTNGEWDEENKQIHDQEVREVRTTAAIVLMLLTMPISYAMLGEAMRKMRIKRGRT